MQNSPFNVVCRAQPLLLLPLIAGIAGPLNAAGLPSHFNIPFVSFGSVWTFQSDDEDRGTAWRQSEYDDGAWPSGPAPLGYGIGGEATDLLPDPQRPAPQTIYFRHAFDIPADLPRLHGVTLRLARDDGAIVYLNGQEVYRGNMNTGTVSHADLALEDVAGRDATNHLQRAVSQFHLLEGRNVLAVELHQAAEGRNDARFDLALLGNLPLTPPTVTIVRPANGSSISYPGPIEFVPEVFDLDGHVDRVEYYDGTNLIHTATAEPFAFNWQNARSERIPMSARAIDNSGRSSFSETVYVQHGLTLGSRLIRGPYLQNASPHAITVRWRSDWTTMSRVWYSKVLGDVSTSVIDFAPTAEHEVRLTNLEPDTKYYYRVGSSDGVLAEGPQYYFATPPTNARPTRVWVIGDSGTADEFARGVYGAFNDFASETRRADLWLMLGDNAYEVGTDFEYQRAVFDMYPELLRNTVLWPALGNHELGVGTAETFAYARIFSLPTQGEAGGMPSGTELYYSFDHANIHFICLDSQISDRSPGSPMLTWLEEDLLQTSQDWIVAFWHHPPYSKGTHDSDLEFQLVEVRRHFLPILERYGVDLVLAGHSHVYERSYLLNGHYGYSTNLEPSMILDPGSGWPDDTGPYTKPEGALGARRGTVYAVCGNSGQRASLIPNHPAIYRSFNGYGSMVLDFDGPRLDAYCIANTEAIIDRFTLLKTPPSGVPPLLQAGRSAVAAPGGETGGAAVKLAWPADLPDRSFVLQSAPLDDPDRGWQVVTNSPRLRGKWQELELETAGSRSLFRLQSVPR